MTDLIIIMKMKTKFFTRLFVNIFLVLFIIIGFSAIFPQTVHASHEKVVCYWVKTDICARMCTDKSYGCCEYKYELHCTYYSSYRFSTIMKDYSSYKFLMIMKDLGVNETGIQKITATFDKEIQAYNSYSSVVSNTIQNLREVEMNEDNIDRVLAAKKGEISGTYTLPSEVSALAAGEDIPQPIEVTEEILADLIQATKDYDIAKLNTIARIKEAGINDEAKIEEIIDIVYEPIRAADTIYDAVNQTMVNFPFMGKIFGSEKMNIYIDDQTPFNIITSGGRVESLNPGEIENPTMLVNSDMETIDQIIAGTLTPLDALQQGKISYKGVGFVKSIRIGVLKFVSGLFS